MTPEDRLRAAGVREEEAPRMVGKLRLYTPRELLSLPPRRYLLPGLLAPGDLSVWWGAPKCGKTFLVLCLAFGLAHGLPLWGRRPARPVRVLYGSAEGHGGMPMRIAALIERLGDPGDHLLIVNQSIILGPPADDLADFTAAARQHRAQLVVVDTLARTFGEGDEDTAQDMGGFLASLDRLRAEGREKGDDPPHVAVIHHGPKDPSAKMPRGSGALLGAADLVVKVTKGGEGEPSLATVELAKDDADGAALAFRLRVVPMGHDDEGNPRQTCIAEEAEAEGEAGTKRPKLSTQARRALGFLHDIIARSGNTLPAGGLFPLDASLRCIPFEDWRAECRARTLSANAEKRAENQAFQRAAEALMTAGCVATGEHSGVRLVWTTRGAGT